MRIIEAKYDLGQVVQFHRPIKQVNGKTRDVEVHVGFITSIRFDSHGVRYYTSSGGKLGFAGIVEEDWIKCAMYPDCYFSPSLTD
jgi:hypothetical protein